MALLVVATTAVGVAAAIAAARLPLRGLTERLVAALLLGQAGITGLLLVLGAGFRTLDPGAVVLAALAIPIGLTITIGGAGRRRVRRSLGEVLAAFRRHGRPAALGLPVLALGAVVLASTAWRAALAVRLPVLDHDGLNYHMVTAAAWFQAGAIGPIPQQTFSDGYPANGELLTLWSMVFLANDSLATVPSLFGLVLAVAVTIGLARAVGASVPAAVLAGLLAATVPALVVLVGTAYVDPLMAADLGAAWLFGLGALTEPRPDRRRWLLVATGVAAGLAIGVKLTAAVLVAAILGIVALDAIRRRWLERRAAPARAALFGVAGDALALGLPVLLLGGYWYVRNLVAHGNPAWPYTLGPFGGIWPLEPMGPGRPVELDGLDGLTAVVRSWVADFSLRDYPYDVRLGGFGVAWVGILALAITGLALLGRTRRWPVWLLIVVPVVLVLAIMPSSFWARYTLYVPLIGLALAALALTRVPARGATFASLLLVVAATWSLGVATIHGNLVTGRDGQARAPLPNLVRLVTASRAERQTLGLWGACARLATIPAGDRVATDNFIFQHLVIGHGLDRILTAKVTVTDDPAVLRDDVRRLGARWLVLDRDRAPMRVVLADPAAYRVAGPVCRNADLVEVVDPGATGGMPG